MKKQKIHITTKEERDRMWAELGARREEERKQNRGEPPAPKDWEIVYREGKPFTVCPWGQELPSAGEALYFWEILEEYKTGTSEERQDEFLEGWGKGADEDARKLLRGFCEWIDQVAMDAARTRERERLESIEEVRQAVKYYDEED